MSSSWDAILPCCHRPTNVIQELSGKNNSFTGRKTNRQNQPSYFFFLYRQGRRPQKHPHWTDRLSAKMISSTRTLMFTAIISWRWSRLALARLGYITSRVYCALRAHSCATSTTCTTSSSCDYITWMTFHTLACSRWLGLRLERYNVTGRVQLVHTRLLHGHASFSKSKRPSRFLQGLRSSLINDRGCFPSWPDV